MVLWLLCGVMGVNSFHVGLYADMWRYVALCGVTLRYVTLCDVV